MQKFIRASVLATTFAATAVVIGATGAKAETITFNGTVAKSCTFVSLNDGTLTPSADLRTFGTGEAGGVAAQTELTCNAPATVAISGLTPAAGSVNGTDISALTGYTASAEVTDGTGTADTSGATFTYGAAGATTIQNLSISLTASATDPIPADTYSFTVDVTATPQ